MMLVSIDDLSNKTHIEQMNTLLEQRPPFYSAVMVRLRMYT